MEKEYYYLSGETKVGPFTLEGIKNAPITSNTLVWNNTLTDWVPASSLPEFQEKFGSTTVTVTPPQAQTYTQTNYSAGTKPPMPDNYLVWAILSTVLCCVPFGIVSIIQSSKVSSAYAVGDYEGAKAAAENAKKWAIIAAVSGLVFGVLYCIFIFAVGASSAFV